MTTVKKATGVALIRTWAREAAKQKSVREVYQALHGILKDIEQDFLTQHDMPGVRYWLHPESDCYFLTPPGESLGQNMDAELCIELTRPEFLSRQGIHFGYENTEL